METFAEMFERLDVIRLPEHAMVFQQAKRVRRFIKRLAKERQGGDLVGFCAIASAELFRQLKKAGVDHIELAMWINQYNDAHVFLLWQDFVVDITATQFGHSWTRAVEIRPLKEAISLLEKWQPLYTFKDPDDLRRDQLENGWPEEQVALTHEMM